MSIRQSRSSISQKLSQTKQLSNKQKSIKSNKNSQKQQKSQRSQKQQRQQRSLKSQKLQKHSSKSSPQSVSSNNGSSQLSQKQQKVMGEAIQKASYLIELLKRDNSELRQLVDDLQVQLAQQKENHQLLRQKYHEVVNTTNRLDDINRQNQRLTEQNIELVKQNEQIQIQLQKNRINKDHYILTKQQLQQSKQKNKQLHIKIAHLTKSTTQLNTSLVTIKKQFLSLQNQNQYLLKSLQKHSQKQNIYNLNITQKQTEFNNKLTYLDKTKQAFARRTHQLQQHNLNLMMEIQQLKKDKIDLQIITEESMQTLDALTIKLQTYRMLENKINQIYDKIKLQQKTTHIIKSYDQVSSNQKLYQIQLILNYRLQHVQTLLQQITAQINKNQWKSTFTNLKQTQITVQRLNDYLNQLSTCSLIPDKNII